MISLYIVLPEGLCGIGFGDAEKKTINTMRYNNHLRNVTFNPIYQIILLFYTH